MAAGTLLRNPVAGALQKLQLTHRHVCTSPCPYPCPPSPRVYKGSTTLTVNPLSLVTGYTFVTWLVVANLSFRCASCVCALVCVLRGGAPRGPCR